jgi:hypothetical protein
MIGALGNMLHYYCKLRQGTVCTVDLRLRPDVGVVGFFDCDGGRQRALGRETVMRDA